MSIYLLFLGQALSAGGLVIYYFCAPYIVSLTEYLVRLSLKYGKPIEDNIEASSVLNSRLAIVNYVESFFNSQNVHFVLTWIFSGILVLSAGYAIFCLIQKTYTPTLCWIALVSSIILIIILWAVFVAMHMYR